jgi:hypothetical protein
MFTEKKIIFICVFFVSFIVGLVAFFGFGNKIQDKFFSTKSSIEQAQEKPIANCTDGDEKCISKNANSLANQLTGSSVEFAKHQCDGPRACPTPAPADIEAATTAIHEYAKDDKLQIIPVTGKTPAGIIYYCAKDNRCWSMEAKTNKVISFVDGKKSPTPSVEK